MSKQDEKMRAYLENLKQKQEEQQQIKISPPIKEDDQYYEDDFDDDAIANVVKQSKQENKEKEEKIQSQQKRQMSASKSKPVVSKKPYQFNKLTDTEKERLFLDVYDENLQLKERQSKIEKMYSTLEVKFTQMQKYLGQLPPDKSDGHQTLLNQKVNNLEQENQKLKQKIMALSQFQRVTVVKPPKKKLLSTDKTQVEEQKPHISAAADTQIKDLLKVNDLLKKKLHEQESSYRQLESMIKSRPIPQQQDNATQRNSQYQNLQERYQRLESTIQNYQSQLDAERKKQKDYIQMFQDEKDRAFGLEQKVRALIVDSNALEDCMKELEEVKRSKKDVEQRLTEFRNSPFFQQYSQRANEVQKTQELEREKIENQKQLKILREQTARQETEITIKKDEIAELKKELQELNELNKDLRLEIAQRDDKSMPFKNTGDMNNDQFFKAIGTLKWDGIGPTWKQLDFVGRAKSQSDDPIVLKKEIAHLQMERGEMAAHLEKAQQQLRQQMEIQIERDKVHMKEMEKLQLELRAAYNKAEEYANIADLKTQTKLKKTFYSQGGVKYDDTVSVFSVGDADQLDLGENYFDFYLGNAIFQGMEIQQQFQKLTKQSLDMNSLKTFVTVDFYDHETQHSGVVEGTNCLYNLQISFKIDANAGFIQYLESDYLKIELYVNSGNEAPKIGTGLLQMRNLVEQNTSDTVSNVMNGQMTIKGHNNEFIGIVEYKARMRFPISHVVRLLKTKNQLKYLEQEEFQTVAVRRRKLIIQIEKATGLPDRANSFVYYNLEGEDYHTNTQAGREPQWQYRMIHQVDYNELFVMKIKQAKFEFFVIDDNMPMIEGSSDKVGTASVSLEGLLQEGLVDEASIIKNDDGDSIGSLYIKILWYESNMDDQQFMNQYKNMTAQTWEEQLTNKIQSEMRSNGLIGITAFRLFDRDKDQQISMDDFAHGILNILNLKVNEQELKLYYSKLNQPLDQVTFERIFKLQSVQELSQSMLQLQQSQMQDLSTINQFIQLNSQQLQYGNNELLREQIMEIFRRKMKEGKTKEQIFNEIDSIRPDGYISVEELQGWLMLQRLNIPTQQLRSFLQAYFDFNNDQRIDLREFYEFFLQTRVQLQQQQATRIQNAGQTDPFQLTIQTILNYAKKNMLTLMQVREQIDSDRNNFIDRSEFRNFFGQYGVTQVLSNEQEIDQVLNKFDIDGDGKISVQEFSDALYSENQRQKIITKQPSFSQIQNFVVGYFVTYMQQKRKSMAQLFNDVDANGDGFLSRKELRDMFREKILVPIDEGELEQLYFEFDQDKDNRISIKEFVSLMKPKLEEYEKQKQLQKDLSLDIEFIRRKAEDICTKNRDFLLRAFKQKESKSGLIEVSLFSQTLLNMNYFTQVEIEQLVSKICKLDTFGMIYYQDFLDIARSNQQQQYQQQQQQQQQQQSDLFGQTTNSAFGRMSQIDQERAIGKAKEIFGKISKSIKRSLTNVTNQDLFKTFDLDGNGKLTMTEMGQVFRRMRITLQREDLELVFKAVDRDGNGSIDINEFIKYIDL